MLRQILIGSARRRFPSLSKYQGSCTTTLLLVAVYCSSESQTCRRVQSFRQAGNSASLKENKSDSSLLFHTRVDVDVIMRRESQTTTVRNLYKNQLTRVSGSFTKSWTRHQHYLLLIFTQGYTNACYKLTPTSAWRWWQVIWSGSVWRMN
jgi:hypothetical protein